MKFSERWLREWVDPSIDTDTLVEQLTTLGLEVDSATSAAGDFSGVVVGEVLEVTAHPKADRLHVCQVNAGGSEHLSVVCGAPNVRPGMRSPLAMVGATMPDGRKISKAKLRGVVSQGMLCSETELGISEDGAGIMELGVDAAPGTDLRDYLLLDDVCIDVELTPNRGDCNGVIGIARDVAVRNRCEMLPVRAEAVSAAHGDEFPVRLDAPEDCARYAGRIIRNVDPTAPTPLWMRERLRRSGVRSISAVVDVTNYVMLELGQPMHAFDLERLAGGIRVRRATEGESLTLLDGQTLAVRSDTLLIADEKKAVALAGIMGGLDSAVTDDSRQIFLESAFFSPLSIAGKARRYGMHTDASYRFERGVDPLFQARAVERATALLLDIVGGEAGPVTEALSADHIPSRPTIGLRKERVRRLLGIEVADETVRDVLQRLEMKVETSDDGWRVTPPSFRFDMSIEADLIEEIARITGYDEIPAEMPRARLEMLPREEAKTGLPTMRAALVQRGYFEAITYSFIDGDLGRVLEPDKAALTLANPLSSEMSVMRTSLWPGLIQAMLHNTHRQQERVRLFETGLRFLPTGKALKQEPMIAGVVTGSAAPEQWGVKQRPVDFYDVKADVEAVLASGRGAGYRFVAAEHTALHPGQSARIERDGVLCGVIGRVHPGTARQLKLDAHVYLFELQLDEIRRGKTPKSQPLSRFPALRRDIAVIVDESVSADSVRNCVGQVTGDVLQKFQLFDVYRGEGVDSGKKSLAFGLVFQSPSRTLTDDEVDGLQRQVVDALVQNLDAVQRT